MRMIVYKAIVLIYISSIFSVLYSQELAKTNKSTNATVSDNVERIMVTNSLQPFSPSKSKSGVINKNPNILPFTQLLGFKGGGQLFFNFKTDSYLGLFFENVLNNNFGLVMNLGTVNVPITNYVVPSTTTIIVGSGKKNYIEIGAEFKFYINWIGITILGFSYNDFIGGYITYNSNTSYIELQKSDQNFFSIFSGIELNAQISTDLYSKVGILFCYGINSANLLNNLMYLRFILGFSYGI